MSEKEDDIPAEAKSRVHLGKSADIRYWSKNRLALAFEVDRRVIDQALLEVEPARRDHQSNWMYRLKDVVAPICKAGGFFKGLDEDGNFNPDKFPPKDRKEWYQSEKAKDEVLKSRGELIPRDEVLENYAKLAKALASGLEGLPDILERDCGLSPHVVDKVIEVLDSIRDQIAEDVIFGD